MALFLSLVGIYGLTAFAAVQRTQEIGVRVAFGARPIDVVGLFLRSLRRPFVAGGAGGAVLALISLWVMRRTNLMLDLPAADPLAYAAAIVVLSRRH